MKKIRKWLEDQMEPEEVTPCMVSIAISIILIVIGIFIVAKCKATPHDEIQKDPCYYNPEWTSWEGEVI